MAILPSTPACAGKTRSSSPAAPPSSFNPRVCGENGACGRDRRGDILQPPRVRGKHGFVLCLSIGAPSTPACAGKTSSLLGLRVVFSFNPRVCGENSDRCLRDRPECLQPPRVRGKRMTFLKGFRVRPSTPACAGKTYIRQSGIDGRCFNPRVCGENVVVKEYNGVRSLQPPRVRGKRALGVGTLRVRPSTPACAGKTKSIWIVGGAVIFNPRVCGENKQNQRYCAIYCLQLFLTIKVVNVQI